MATREIEIVDDIALIEPVSGEPAQSEDGQDVLISMRTWFLRVVLCDPYWMKTGELQGVEDLPTKSLEDIKKDKNVTVVPLPNWWIQIAVPSISAPPTDNPLVRKAIQAALDMDEIMDAATDGNYKLNVGFQYPNQPSYTDAGKETYNIKDPAKAKEYLRQAGYKGEPIVLLTNKDYTSMYNAALVMAEQLKLVGMKAELKVVDWPTSMGIMTKNEPGWNFFFTGYGTQPALGALATMQFFTPPGANSNRCGLSFVGRLSLFRARGLFRRRPPSG